MPTAGDLIGGRYRLRAEIGRGGMSRIWEADDTRGGRTVAIKFLRLDVDDDQLLERFRAEVHIASGLRSPHIAAVFDHGTEGPTPYMVMERLVGEDLATRLRREGRLAPRACVAIVRDLARGLEVAHRAGVVHRDVKVQNVFLVRGDEGSEVVKLVDFGVAKIRDAGPRTRTGLVVGSPLALSPEQIVGSRSIDARSDLFSLGSLIYRCLLGAPPFRGDLPTLFEAIGRGRYHAPTKEDPSLPPALDDFFARALAARPEDRFASATAMADAFEAAVLGASGDDLHTMATRVMPRPLQDSVPTTRPPTMPDRADRSPEDHAASGPRPPAPFGKTAAWHAIPCVRAAPVTHPKRSTAPASVLAAAALFGALGAGLLVALS